MTKVKSNAPPSLAFFVISTHLGGAEKSLLDFIVPLKQKDNANFVVVVPKDSGPLINELQTHDIPFAVLKIPKPLLQLSRKTPIKNLFLALPCALLLIYFLIKTLYFLKSHRLETVHSTGLKFHLILALLSRFHNFKLVIHLRDILANNWLKKLFLLFGKKESIQFVSNSKATSQSLEPLTSKIIYNGFDDQRFYPNPNTDIKRHFQLPPESLLVGTVGVLARWKGQREFVEMAALLAAKYPQTYFVIVGSEIYDTRGEVGERAKLESLVLEKGLQERIFFLSFQKEIQRIYNSLDVFVHCSVDPEPFGRVVVEAMLCGCPVVTANAGGPAEFVLHETNGLLYSLNDVAEMTQSVERLINNSVERENISAQALAIKSQFSLNAYHNQLKDVLGMSAKGA